MFILKKGDNHVTDNTCATSFVFCVFFGVLVILWLYFSPVGTWSSYNSFMAKGRKGIYYYHYIFWYQSLFFFQIRNNKSFIWNCYLYLEIKCYQYICLEIGFFFYCVMKGWKDMNWDTKFKINNQIFVLKIPRQLKPFIIRWKPVSLQ